MTSPPSESKTLLLGFIKQAKECAIGIADLQAETSDICKEAKSAGFEPTKIREVVRWLMKIDKHGRDKVDEAEAIYALYRQVADPEAKALPAMMPEERDQALLRIFAPAGDAAIEEKLSKRTQSMRAAMALGRAASEARRS